MTLMTQVRRVRGSQGSCGCGGYFRTHISSGSWEPLTERDAAQQWQIKRQTACGIPRAVKLTVRASAIIERHANIAERVRLRPQPTWPSVSLLFKDTLALSYHHVLILGHPHFLLFLILTWLTGELPYSRTVWTNSTFNSHPRLNQFRNLNKSPMQLFFFTLPYHQNQKDGVDYSLFWLIWISLWPRNPPHVTFKGSGSWGFRLPLR